MKQEDKKVISSFDLLCPTRSDYNSYSCINNNNTKLKFKCYIKLNAKY